MIPVGPQHLNSLVIVSGDGQQRAALLAQWTAASFDVRFVRGGAISTFVRRPPLECRLPSAAVLADGPIAVDASLLADAVRAFLAADCASVAVSLDPQYGEYLLRAELVPAH